MSKRKFLKQILSVLVGLGYLILQNQVKNLLQVPIAELGLAIPGIALLSPFIDLTEILQDALVDSIVKGSIVLRLMVTSWQITHRKQKL